MSLERRGKTLGINNWKFNQGGFKDGGSAGARAGMCCFPTEVAVKSSSSGF